MVVCKLDLEKAILQYEKLLQQTVVALMAQEDQMELVLINVIELRGKMRSILETMQTCRVASICH